jgi:hypothetical protein
MAIGLSKPMACTNRFDDVLTSAIPTRRFQPTWRLGTAAYLFTRFGGCSTR